MESPVISPVAGGRGTLTPKEAKRYFEFFTTGTHREVLLLGDLVEQPVHYVRSKGHKVLCGARVGVCELCESAAGSDDVSVQQTEYYAAAYVRAWRERDFHQRITVWSAAAGEQVLALIPAGSARGHRLDVERYSQGTSGRFRIKLMDGLPRGFPGVLPAAFDLVPFIRARFGRQQDPHRPLVFLPSFRSEFVSGSGGRPKPLALTAADCVLDAEERAKVKELLGRVTGRARTPDPTGHVAAAPAAVSPPPATVPITDALPVVESVEVKPAPAEKPKPHAARSITPTPEQALEALQRRGVQTKPTSELTAAEAVHFGKITEYVLGKAPATIPFTSNGKHHANGTAGNGGAK